MGIAVSSMGKALGTGRAEDQNCEQMIGCTEISVSPFWCKLCRFKTCHSRYFSPPKTSSKLFTSVVHLKNFLLNFYF